MLGTLDETIQKFDCYYVNDCLSLLYINVNIYNACAVKSNS